ncbi:MAG: hypothetical protein QOD95_1640 [Gammaproteobacteria bacterium]|jgi:DNA-binding transcriptional LysR family regulator|nr:hypothetical protein [Gammaproteobacteria bacterium]
MQLTLRQLQIFRAISIHGSTSAGAASLPLSQSATSAALNELERALGARLFDRVGKRLILNDNGRAVLPAALAVLDGAHGIEASFQSADRGLVIDLRVSASTTIGNYLLPAVLARFRESHPRARVELQIGNTLNVVTAVRDFAADMGLIEGPCHESDVQVLPWLEDELVIVAAPAHSLAKAAKHRKLTANQLRGAHWLLREHGSGTREAVEAALLPHLRHIQSAMILGSSEAIKYSIAEGLGLSCLSRCVVQELVIGKRLAILSTQLPRLSRQFSLIHHREKVLSKPLAAFIAHCRGFADRDRRSWPDKI